ncbi:13265_t:CDS:10 [Ambispora leptoticha]|uniref:13265_t:CDS:1 n=1 Tax=Ambispora leptoticha TaxID=144679 RepID=A0A9N9CCG4_9GLOM|nr:13265_t:CDS:10 [Ambispora leptoticha]
MNYQQQEEYYNSLLPPQNNNRQPQQQEVESYLASNTPVAALPTAALPTAALPAGTLPNAALPTATLPTAAFSTSAPINYNAPSVFSGGLRDNSSESSTQQSSNLLGKQVEAQPSLQPSPYDIANISTSMDPLFSLGSVIGGGLANMAAGAGGVGGDGVDGSNIPGPSTGGINPMIPPMLGPISSLPGQPGGLGHGVSNFPGLYSSTGFDMLGVLARVASRPNPQINIGPVDMSCSFLVVDARKYDFPIVYASHTFEKLTGYSNSEIIGRNCRFLQAPDGHVALGSRRRYTDNNAVYHIKSHMVSGKECQASIINYRKGGQPFINLVTVIPITWDSEEIAYFVGFQVDLVEQPNAILEKMKDGTYVVNYQLMNLPTYIPPNPSYAGPVVVDDYLREISSGAMPFPASPEVFDLIGGNGDTEMSKRLWNKMLLEHSDDFIHVLSLKGIFLYCSPSSRRMLEYEPDELVGKSLSTICHPSDIVPVMRELKESSNGVEAVNLVYRIRRKNTGYMWLEAHGKLHLEQGKGRKCVILSARERLVYKLTWKDLQVAGGICDNQFWAKLSLDGLYLYASSACQSTLGYTPDELVGTSLYHLVKSDRTTEITRALSRASIGISVNLNHTIHKKNGQYVEVVSTFFPGDSGANQKPSFIICQSKEIQQELRRRSSSTASTPIHQSSSPLTSSGSPDGSSTFSSSSGGSTPTHSIHLRKLSIEHADTDNIFEELDTTRSTSWQYELHQMRLTNKKLREELEAIKHSKKKRKKRSASSSNKVCAHCQRKDSPEWRKGPGGPKSLCNACGLRYAKQVSSTGSGSSTGTPSITSPNIK